MQCLTQGASRLAVVTTVTLLSAATVAAPPLQVAVPGANGVIRVWDEVDRQGQVRHFYSISLDGGRRARVVETSYDLLLRYARFDPLDGAPAVPAELAMQPAEESIYIVQFVTQPLQAYRDAIRDLGATVYTYLGHHAHLVRMTVAAAAQVRTLPFVRWAGAYEPAYRLEPYLVANLDDAYELYPLQRYNIMVFEAGPAQKTAVARRIEALGGFVNRRNSGKHLLEATLTPDELFEVVTWNEVFWVDRWTPWGTDMDIVREIGGANFVETVEGFTGRGVRGEVLDVGFNLTHGDFQATPLILHTPVGIDSHGASTSGIIFGDGTGNTMGRGLVPDAQGIVADAGIAFAGRYTHTGQLVEAPYFAVFQSSSVGSSQVADYTSISADMDAMLFDFDILHCQSQSNTGNQDSRPQAWAKNIVSVGGIRHQNTLTTADDCWNCGPNAASIGPASDGRLKPDLAHFYDNIFTVTAGSPAAYTTSFGGTSGATPIIAGHFGIFFQMWAEGLFGYPVDPTATVFENRPHMTTAKAMLINTADQWAFNGTSHDLTRTHQGWGRANVANLHSLRDKMLIVDETDLLQNLESIAYDVVVEPGEPSFKATLVYADPPGVPGSTRHRINDLTLKVTSPGGTVYWGNNGLEASTRSTAGGVPNTVDTVENVFVPLPAAGTWTVEIFADEINQDSHVETAALDADFALVVSGVQQVVPAMLIRLPDGTPSLVPPVTATDIAVEVVSGGETVVPSLAMLHYRFDAGDAFTAVAMTHDGGIGFTATLPGALCTAMPQFYFSAEGDGGTRVTNPSGAPLQFYQSSVGTIVTLLSDDFETDMGWTVENDPNLTDGQWDRGVPVGGGDRGDPPTDFDGSGQCWLTDNVDGNSDVDGGFTRLISPAFDLSATPDAAINYALWYTNNAGADPGNDIFNTYISDDDGANWVLAQTFGPQSLGGWTMQSLLVSDFVATTSTVRVRFEASDLAGGSVVEAGVDALSITRSECKDGCPGDVDGDGVVGIQDFLDLLAAWGPNPGHPADLDGDGVVGILDFLELLAAWGPC